MTTIQAWNNVVSVVHEFKGLTLGEASILQQSLEILQKELFPPEKDTSKKKEKKDSK